MFVAFAFRHFVTLANRPVCVFLSVRRKRSNWRWRRAPSLTLSSAASERQSTSSNLPQITEEVISGTDETAEELFKGQITVVVTQACRMLYVIEMRTGRVKSTATCCVALDAMAAQTAFAPGVSARVFIFLRGVVIGLSAVRHITLAPVMTSNRIVMKSTGFPVMSIGFLRLRHWYDSVFHEQ